MMEKIPEPLTHPHYCPECFGSQVAEPLTRYQEVLSAAREAFVFFVTQRKGVPVLKKDKVPVRAEGREDRDEVILRLAFQAAEKGHNAIIECDVKSEKKRNAGWQKMLWSGTAFPATVDVAKLERY